MPVGARTGWLLETFQGPDYQNLDRSTWLLQTGHRPRAIATTVAAIGLSSLAAAFMPPSTTRLAVGTASRDLRRLLRSWRHYRASPS